MRRYVYETSFAELGKEDLTQVDCCDSFGRSGFATSIATLGLLEDDTNSEPESTIRTRREGSSVDPSCAAASTTTVDDPRHPVSTRVDDRRQTIRPFPRCGLALTENPDGTFSAVEVYGPTQAYDMTALGLAKTHADDDRQIAFDFTGALRRLGARST